MWTWTLGLVETLIVLSFRLATGGQESHQRGHRLRVHGVVDVALLLAALDQTGPPQEVQVVGQGRPRHLHRLLDLAGRYLPSGPDQEEEDLEPGEVGQGPEGLDVALARRELGQGERLACFHGSISIEMWSRCQAKISGRAGPAVY